jgi:hypothetical protein
LKNRGARDDGFYSRKRQELKQKKRDLFTMDRGLISIKLRVSFAKRSRV